MTVPNPRDEARLIVPPPDLEPWPTLGYEICDFIEAELVHGPGDVRGHPAVLMDEVRAFILRAYEVYPAGHPRAGQRRFNRAVLSRRKGFSKTECLAWLAICELSPDCPVRFDHWDGDIPVGKPVADPYIPLVATTEEQSEDLAYGAVIAVLENCEYGSNFVLTQERIEHRKAPGVIKALASAPNARDGARTSFAGMDETHLWTSRHDRLRKAHATMLRNMPKRRAADPWTMETTTMYEPGEDSIAEQAHTYALNVLAGRIKDSTLLFDHRQASTVHRLTNHEGRMAAIREASGDAWEFTYPEAIESQLLDPEADEPAFRRYWLNQRVKGSATWIGKDVFARLATPSRGRPPEGTEVVLGFDGSESRDATVLIGATVEAVPYLWVEKVWERPAGAKGIGWRVPVLDVEAAKDAAFARFDVVELAPDPPGWRQEIEGWESEHGEVVVLFETKQPKRMGPACDKFVQAVRESGLSWDGSEVLARHLANCVPVVRNGYTVVSKDDKNSALKIDAAVGMIIAHDRARWRHLNRPVRRKPLYAFA